MVNILLLIAGNFMEPSSILLITAPILFPVAMKLGIDPIHLGIIMTVNMEIGMITPPVGLNLYVASGISGMGLTETTKACAPWILVMIALPADDHLHPGHQPVAAEPADGRELERALGPQDAPPAPADENSPSCALARGWHSHARPYRKSHACLLGCDQAGKSFKRARTHRNNIACAP